MAKKQRSKPLSPDLGHLLPYSCQRHINSSARPGLKTVITAAISFKYDGEMKNPTQIDSRRG